MATLAWEIAAERERLGFGTIVVLHQLGHPEKQRKKPADYDEHERYNVKADALAHAITPDMLTCPSTCPFDKLANDKRSYGMNRYSRKT